jgi:hypothetical protein
LAVTLVCFSPVAAESYRRSPKVASAAERGDQYEKRQTECGHSACQVASGSTCLSGRSIHRHVCIYLCTYARLCVCLCVCVCTCACSTKRIADNIITCTELGKIAGFYGHDVETSVSIKGKYFLEEKNNHVSSF